MAISQRFREGLKKIEEEENWPGTFLIQQQKGKFVLATGGTLFLDEIGEMDLRIQPKVLRAIENGEIQRVGGNDCIKVDVRLIAATNRDLKSAVQKKEFRDDLFFRLNVINIHIPPLREHREDIPLLAEYFMTVYAGSANVNPCNYHLLLLQNFSIILGLVIFVNCET